VTAVLALRAARIFDGIDPVEPGPAGSWVVLVDEGRIGGLAGAAPPGVPVLDFGDATLLPGLVDAHLHLVLDAAPDPIARLSTVDDDALLEVARAAARTTLDAGVTTARDLGDRAYLGVRLRDDAGDAPRLLAAGPPITVPGGHCWFLGGEVSGEAALRAAVRERAARGVDVIKVMASGGGLTPGSRSWLPQYTVEELRAVVEEARAHGLPVTAHAHAVSSIAAAVEAGVDTVEHCSFITADGVESDTGVVDAILAAGTVVSYTCGMVPGAGGPLPAMASRTDGLRANLRALRAAGVPLAASSDAGIIPAKPHGLLPYSAAAFVEAGFTPVEALRAVTSTAARAVGLADLVGRLAPGYAADVLVVAGDPLRDIGALRSVTAVFRDGVRVR
jgi:imidazolonepropionase-like amidohydrolase